MMLCRKIVIFNKKKLEIVAKLWQIGTPNGVFVVYMILIQAIVFVSNFNPIKEL